jgi:hypothetical protein
MVVVSFFKQVFFFFLDQNNPTLLMIMDFFSLSKGATTSFKLVYKCHGQQLKIFSFFYEGASTFVKSN